MRKTLAIFLVFISSIACFAQAKKEKAQTAKQEQLLTEGMRHYMKEDFDEAIFVLESLLTQLKTEPAVYYYLSKAYLAQQKPAFALQYAKKAHDLSPYSLDYGLFFSQQLIEDKQYAEAIACLKQLTQYDESQVEVNMQLAQAYLWNEQGDLAIQALDRADRVVGDYPEIIRTKQFVHIKQGKLIQALRAGEKLLDQDPEELFLPWDQMDAAWELSKADSLSKSIHPFLAKYPNQGQLYLLVASQFIHRKQFDSTLVAIDHAADDSRILPELTAQVLMKAFEQIDSPAKWDKALVLANHLVDVFPKEPRFHAIIGDLQISNQKVAEGISWYLQAARMGTPKYEVWSRIIQLDFEMNAVDSALVHIDEALRAFPKQGFLWFQQGFARYLTGQAKAAIEPLEMAKTFPAEKEGWAIQLHSILGDVYHAVQNDVASDAAFDYVLERDPTDEHVLNNYSYYLSLRKAKLDQAATMSKRLVEAHPLNATYLDTYAWVLYQQSFFKEALTYMERAVSDTKEASSTIWEHYGDVLFRLDRVDEAVAAWKKAKLLPDANQLLDKKIKKKQLLEN